MSMRSLWWLAVPVLGYLYWRRRGANEDDTPQRYENGLYEYRVPALDLHGCKAKDAEDKTRLFLDENGSKHLRGYGVSKVIIITGQGNHSIFGAPVVKPIVDKYLKKNYRKFSWDKPGGTVTVDLASKK